VFVWRRAGAPRAPPPTTRGIRNPCRLPETRWDTMATKRQIEANRANSRLSTGPRTAAGRERSKCNAADHCLSGEGLVLPEQEAAAVNDRFAQWQSSLRPFDIYDLWLYELLVIESVRIDTAQRKLTALRHEQAHRAQHSWDDDQAGEAERIAERLAPSPRPPAAPPPS